MTQRRKGKTRKGATGPLKQVAALPFRLTSEGDLEVLLLTSRETQRFIVPKGWPMKGRKDWKAAQIEAAQEAGVVGDIARKPFGRYKYWKRFEDHFSLVDARVFPLQVKRQLAVWPERHQRSQKWLSPEEAASLVDEGDLATLIKQFARQNMKSRGLKPAKAATVPPTEAS